MKHAYEYLFWVNTAYGVALACFIGPPAALLIALLSLVISSLGLDIYILRKGRI